MARKKKNIMKALVQNGVVRDIASVVGNTAINAIPNAEVRTAARAAGNILGRATRRRKKNKKSNGIVQIPNQTVQYSNAPTNFGVTVGANSFETTTIDKETIRCIGKLDLPVTIGMFNPTVAENDGALIEPDAIEPQEAFVFNPLNVASNDVQSRLGKAAQTYTKYCWKAMTLEYIPSTSTDNPGQFDMAVTWDPAQAAPAEAADLLNFDSSVETSAWKPTRLPIQCPPAGSKEDWCFNELTQDGAANTKLNFACQLFAMIRKPGSSTVGEANTWGTLCLHYACDLTKPTLDDTETTFLMTTIHRVGVLSPQSLMLVEAMLKHEWEKRAKEIEADKSWYENISWMRKGAAKQFPLTVTKDEILDRAMGRGIPPFAFRSSTRSRRWKFLGRCSLKEPNSNESGPAVLQFEYPKGIEIYQVKSSNSPSGNITNGDDGRWRVRAEELAEKLEKLEERLELLQEFQKSIKANQSSSTPSGTGSRTPKTY